MVSRLWRSWGAEIGSSEGMDGRNASRCWALNLWRSGSENNRLYVRGVGALNPQATSLNILGCSVQDARQTRITAPACASNDIPMSNPSSYEESGMRLKAQDARIAALLVTRGAA